jgi:hypothetical protein
MTTQSVAASCITSSGMALTFQDHSVTDGTQQSLTSAGFNQIAGQEAGIIGDGMTVTHALVSFGDNGLYAYFANQDGSINQCLPIARASATIAGVVKLSRPVKLVPGMTLQVMSATTGSTSVSFNAQCASGVNHIFTGTAGTAGAVTDLTSIITSGQVGDVLTGQTIAAAWVSSTADWDAAEAGGFPFVGLISGNGQTKSTWVQQMPVYNQPMPQVYNASVALNDKLQIDTDTA